MWNVYLRAFLLQSLLWVHHSQLRADPMILCRECSSVCHQIWFLIWRLVQHITINLSYLSVNGDGWTFFAFKKSHRLTLGGMLNFVTQCSRLDWEDGRVNDLATAKVRQIYCVADHHLLYFSNDPYSLSVLGHFLTGDSIILLGTNYIKLPTIYYR